MFNVVVADEFPSARCTVTTSHPAAIGIRIAALTLGIRGSATRSAGSAAVTRSATAARNTERTITNRALMVVGAHFADIALTQLSMWKAPDRIHRKLAKPTDPTARSVLARVDGTQSCRGAQSS